jgi:hypothetical protein
VSPISHYSNSPEETYYYYYDDDDDSELYYDDEYPDSEFQRGISDETGAVFYAVSPRATKLWLFCFHCNRTEQHYNSLKGRRFYFFLMGLTFGLVYFYGPFRCRCCGHTRLFKYNRMNPRFLFRKWLQSRMKT